MMPSFRLLAARAEDGHHAGEASACCYAPDNMFALTGGWDGRLRLWDAHTGRCVSALAASPKPLSGCAVTPDGAFWLAGDLDGLLTRWDPVSHQLASALVAHARPVSGIVFAHGGRLMATSSWDCKVTLWELDRDRAGRSLGGHQDIVAGCRFTADGQSLLSWSHDGTARVWDTRGGKATHTLAGHDDRVLAGAVSPDGAWALTGSRDGLLKLWDLRGGGEVAAAELGAEARGCFFLLDGESAVAVSADGVVRLFTLPQLEPAGELATGLAVTCCDLASSGAQLAIGDANGAAHFVAVEGFDRAPLSVTATRSTRRTATRLQRLMGKSSDVDIFVCVCPVCRKPVELSEADPSAKARCPHCGRGLKVSVVLQELGA